jgi:hypothetical protein
LVVIGQQKIGHQTIHHIIESVRYMILSTHPYKPVL